MNLDTDKIELFNNLAGHGPLDPVYDRSKHSLALALIVEETNELLNSIWEAQNPDLILDSTDEDMFKEMLDTIWVIISYCQRRGWNLPEGFRRLGESNLSKFNKNTDGTYWAEYLPSGKVKKSSNYKAPDLIDLVRYPTPWTVA